MLEKEVRDTDPEELLKIEQAAEKAYGKAATKTAKTATTKLVKKAVKKSEPYELPITALRGSLKKAVAKLGEEEVAEYEVKKPPRALSLPLRPSLLHRSINTSIKRRR